ncbi:MAG: ABC transporter ATP-binding protein [Propionibacteriaceae bacterium]|jgi:energy-coupling factor transport system ATP-binding protein|nr:ABC transporter ATP-binding protein [Propionibacteriaceae bacterium]
MIRLREVSWTYPHAVRPSLRDIDLKVSAGQLVVLCGASGCGKSTLLRTLNGLIPHFQDEGVLSGTVSVGGLALQRAELAQIGLLTGTVLQHPRRQFFTDTVAEELAFAMENFGFPAPAIRTRVAQLSAQLGQEGPAPGASLGRLSGGWQQRVAIAAAWAHRPAVLLLDEPSSNLSAEAVDQLAQTLGRLKAEGVTIVVAEHRLRYLRDLADRLVILRDGAIAAEWSAAEFRAASDQRLAEQGLRGEVRPAVLPALPAKGLSLAQPEPQPADPSALLSGSSSGLELDQVVCRLGGRRVLDLAQVRFPAGQVTAVRGVNGAGKSTLARIVTGLQAALGQVRLDGQSLSRRTRQRVSAIVMQDVQRQLFTDSVQAEIELAASERPDGPSPAAVLDSLDLTYLADRHPLSLSGGQQQRLVVATVRLSGRRVVVFDEPSSGVDRRHLGSISDQIRQVAASGAVVLLISHDEDLLALAGDNQLTLRPVADLDPG